MRKSRWLGGLMSVIVVGAGIVFFFSSAIERYIDRHEGTPAADGLQTIHVAEKVYKMNFPQRGFSRTLAELGPGDMGCPSPPTESAACLIDLSLATSSAIAKSGYIYTYVPGPPNAQGMIESYSVRRDPAAPQFGMNHYYIDQTGIERVERDKPAGKDSPIKQPD
jgi:hypothetical protein